MYLLYTIFHEDYHILDLQKKYKRSKLLMLNSRDAWAAPYLYKAFSGPDLLLELYYEN